MTRCRTSVLLLVLSLSPRVAMWGQAPAAFTHADTLRGSNTPERAWWDAAFYDLHVRVMPADSSVQGYNAITYRVLQPARDMQIDLQAPLGVDSIVQRGKRLSFRRDGNAFLVTLVAPQRAGAEERLTVYYHGDWRTAEGGGGPFYWAQDSLGAPWIATSDEDQGASAWWPLKDYPADEPDSQRIAVTVPDPMIDVSNGRLRGTTHNHDGTTTYEWFVTEPINSYDVAINANEHYVHFGDVHQGEGGGLTLDFWPLSYHLDTARVQFRQAHPMLECYERWFGPYPWYPDGYKLIETPYLGMEHQSGIAYGNKYLQGYLGRDLSQSGVGMQWDYIIVHESAHEWWGNSISSKDHADMWLHESFAMYAEVLFTECQQGREAAAQYVIGLRPRIKNDIPIVGRYGVADTPKSQDRYYKGANILHTIRQLVDDDARWTRTLRGLNQTFWHRTVWGREVEDYISRETGVDLRSVFAEYLRTTLVPTLEYRIDAATLSYRWSNVIPGFDMPLRVTFGDSAYTLVHPTENWRAAPVPLANPAGFRVDPNFYVIVTNVSAPRSR
jgi:aminopeptidase N